jgi:hypothetical protein
MCSNHLNSDSSDDDGGDGKLDARCTRCNICSTKGPWNSHSTDTGDSIRTDNSHSRIRSSDSHSSCIGKPDNQIRFRRPRFRLIPEHQNAEQEQKPVRTPSMQLTEDFSP